MCDKASEVSSNDTVPCGTLSLVKRSLDVLGNVLSSLGQPCAIRFILQVDLSILSRSVISLMDRKVEGG